MSPWAMLLVAVPLQLLIVWLYFLLGRAWQSEIHSDDTLPFLAARLLRRDQVRRLREAPCMSTAPGWSYWRGSPSSLPACWPQLPVHPA